MQKTSACHKMGLLACQIRNAGSILVAFSGGVDSSFLLASVHEILGPRASAATAASAIHPERETEAAVEFASSMGIDHIVFRSEELDLPAFRSNGPDRCYHCKKSLFQKLAAIARQRGIRHIAHAANFDDLEDYRPGFRAAREMGVMAPLLDAGLTKTDIRLLSKEKGLLHWDKPAQACLATRIPYGDSITVEKLAMIDKAESFLIARGFGQCRVRVHGDVARIELKEAGLKMIQTDELRSSVVCEFRQIGFSHISVDLEGYVCGSMNRALKAH